MCEHKRYYTPSAPLVLVKAGARGSSIAVAIRSFDRTLQKPGKQIRWAVPTLQEQRLVREGTLSQSLFAPLIAPYRNRG
ncbi:MAG: hypothetical protein OXI86_00925, partial [Candidatus Poribacteria bacterium]|nr:hypothetical protein [Candidatus Poribacteria bacterium]